MNTLATETSGLTGIVLFAHGSRDAQWRVPIESIASRIRLLRAGTSVTCAYLELCAPTLPDAATKLIADGVQNLKIFPVFFGAGKHVREDLPKLVAQVRAEHPGIDVELLPTAGEYEQLISLMADIALMPAGSV